MSHFLRPGASVNFAPLGNQTNLETGFKWNYWGLRPWGSSEGILRVFKFLMQGERATPPAVIFYPNN
jgi:hypothetical protein